MPIKHAIWTVGDQRTPLPITRLATEQLLEDMIENDPRILSEQWMLIGRQEHTPTGGRIDLLAIAPDASLVLIELKRDKAPRDIVAQAIEVVKNADYHREFADDPEKAEYFVKINWLETVPVEKAFHEVGFFGNQNSACKPQTPKWRKTTDRLKEYFTKWDQ